MKKFLTFCVALAASSTLALAAVPVQCGASNYTLATFATATASGIAGECEIGDKIYSAFSGTLPSSLVFNFTGGGTSSGSIYTVTVDDATVAAMNATDNFTLNYTVAIDESQIVGGTNTMTQVGAGINDSSAANATNGATVTVNNGTNCTGGQVTSVDAAGFVGSSPKCSTGLSTTSLNVAESYSYTSGSNSITSVSTSVTQTFTATSATPEPFSMLLLGSGLLGISLIGRKKLVRK